MIFLIIIVWMEKNILLNQPTFSLEIDLSNVLLWILLKLAIKQF